MRVFFDTYVGRVLEPDADGLELAHESDARAAALAAVAELAADYRHDPGPFAVVARTEGGRVLVRADLKLTVG